ncbi:PREDICTED: uncharacterized protein LOC108358657 [Rhagoletis zephyria]|uniref:uncharacterized protein LOC108358657 n=1 Tax=Rhagoletis zephyria TaxID=28612 RepID=UPI0008119E84|nr:PREDICTED: uncharacterized protein LOC108358657 [Rhagoletis zephyria]
MSNFHKLFNSETITGRANVAKATYASFAVLYIMHRLRKRSKASHSDTQAAAAGKSVTEGKSDPEIWKGELGSEKSPAPPGDDGDTNESAISAVSIGN